MGDTWPDQPAPSGDGGTRSAALIGLIGIGVVIVFFAFGLGRLTAPTEEPGTVAQPTTTIDTIEVAVGEPLAWGQAAEIGEIWPTSLVEHDGTIYLFGSSSAPFDFPSSEGGGLTAWSSTDGTAWESMGTVIPAPAQVQSVVSTPRGLMALGVAGSDGTPYAWISSDGVTWSASELPLAAAEPGLDTFIQAAGANDEAIVVFGMSYPSHERLIFDALGEEAGGDLGQRYGFGLGGPPLTVTIHGPFGLVVHSASAEDLGLTEEEADLLMYGGPIEEELVTQWRSTDGVSWTTSAVETGGVQRVWTAADGTLVASAWGFTGTETWTSPDGIDWTREPASGDVEVHGPWRDGLIGSRHYGPSQELLFASGDQDWTSLGVEAALPEGLSWNYWPIATGDAGIALVANGYDEFMGTTFEEPEPVVLDKDGYTLTVEEARGVLTLTRGDEEVLRLPLHVDRKHDEVDADLRAETLTLLDPETLERLVTFTFDELDEAQQAAYAALESGVGEQQVFMFSADGAAWSAQDLGGEFGEDARLSDLLVADDRVVATFVTEQGMMFIGPPDVPTLVMWTAALP